MNHLESHLPTVLRNMHAFETIESEEKPLVSTLAALTACVYILGDLSTQHSFTYIVYLFSDMSNL